MEARQSKYTLGPGKVIQERRKKVLRLRFIRMWPQKQIAEALGVSEATVERDIKAIVKYGQAVGKDAMVRPVQQVVFEMLQSYQERQMERWAEYTKAAGQVVPGKKKGEKAKTIPPDPGLRRRLLNDISEEEERHVKIMQGLGVLPKSPEQLELSGRGGGPIETERTVNLEKLTDEELAALESILSKDQDEPGGGQS